FSLGGFGMALSFGLRAISGISFVLNVKASIEYFSRFITLLGRGDLLGASLSFILGTAHGGLAVWDAITFFKPPSPPFAGAAAAAVIGGGIATLTGRQFIQLIIHHPALAEWLLLHVVPALARMGFGTLSNNLLLANKLPDGFQEKDPRQTTDELRNSPGTAHGGHNLPSVAPGQQWIQNGIGYIPKEVADQLRGRAFTD